MTPSAAALRDYMSELSEEAWHAGWQTDLEFALWHALHGGPRRYGRLTLTDAHLSRLRELSDRCGGWVRFDDDAADEVFVPTDRWRRLVEARTGRAL